ncbi:hypothetical protein BGW38_001732, partial [Lunasporangiospora selenospora]
MPPYHGRLDRSTIKHDENEDVAIQNRSAASRKYHHDSWYRSIRWWFLIGKIQFFAQPQMCIKACLELLILADEKVTMETREMSNYELQQLFRACSHTRQATRTLSKDFKTRKG